MSTPSRSYPTFGALVDAFEAELYRYVLRLTGNRDEADDLFQETLLHALQAFNRLRPRSNHRAWLYRIATDAFLNSCRAARCIRAITCLPPRQRAAFVQRALEGCAFPEIVTALGCSQAAARANVHQAARRLRSILGSGGSRSAVPARRTR